MTRPCEPPDGHCHDWRLAREEHRVIGRRDVWYDATYCVACLVEAVREWFGADVGAYLDFTRQSSFLAAALWKVGMQYSREELPDDTTIETVTLAEGPSHGTFTLSFGATAIDRLLSQPSAEELTLARQLAQNKQVLSERGEGDA